MKKILTILILFIFNSAFGYQVTNISTNISEYISQTNIVVKPRYIPVKKIVYQTVWATNFIPLYYPIYETNEITNVVEVTNMTPAPNYIQHSLVTAGYSYCGRLYFGYDLMNIFSNGYSGLGLGTWWTWNTLREFDHQLDWGVRFSISF